MAACSKAGSERVQNTATVAGNVTDVPVVVTSRGNETSFAFSLNFDTAVMGTPTVTCGTDVAGCSLTVTTQPGRVGIRIIPPAVLTAGMREIAKVTFPTFANNLLSTPVSFGDTPIFRDFTPAEAADMAQDADLDGVAARIAVKRVSTGS